MTRECECGNDLPKTKGSYLDKCRECYQEDTPDEWHTLQCDTDGCIVCEDRLEEMQEVIKPLYVRCLLSRRTGTQSKRLDDFIEQA